MHQRAIEAPGKRRSTKRLVQSGDQPTLADVAALAGVSAMTVSRVLNGGPASDKARRVVQHAVEALHYRPNEAARALAMSRRTDFSTQTPQREEAALGLADLWSPYGKLMSELCKPRS